MFLKVEKILSVNVILEERLNLHDILGIPNTKYAEDLEEEWKDVRFMKH